MVVSVVSPSFLPGPAKRKEVVVVVEESSRSESSRVEDGCDNVGEGEGEDGCMY